VEVKEYEELVGELELRVDRLRSLYEQYFMGIEKTTPSVQHKDVERRIVVLRKEQVRNTALRFRFQMIVQRYNVYQTHWQRICRQIEEGTYKRHVQKAQKRAQELVADAATLMRRPSGSFEIDVTELLPELEIVEDVLPQPHLPPLEDIPESTDEAPVVIPKPIGRVWRKVDAKPPEQKPTEKKPEPPRPQVPRPSALPERRMRELYAKYVEAKRARRESTAGITYESLAQTIEESSRKLREKHGKVVDFEIAEKDGKTILRPVIK